LQLIGKFGLDGFSEKKKNSGMDRVASQVLICVTNLLPEICFQLGVHRA